MSEAECIGAGGDRPDRPLLDSDRHADRLHLERVGDHHAGEAELAAQQVVENLAAHRRGLVAERSDDDVRGHDRPCSSSDRGTERSEGDLVESVHGGERKV
jgi:hypothetical protein